MVKHLSFFILRQNGFVCVSEKNFCINCTRTIKEKIENFVKIQIYFAFRNQVDFPKKLDSIRILIDTDKGKLCRRKFHRRIEKITVKNAVAKTACSEIIKLEHEMKAKAGSLKYVKLYGIKLTNIEKKQTQYDAMTVQKVQLKKTYQMAEKEAADVQLKNIRQHLRIEKQEKEKTDRKHEMNL